MQFKYRVPKQIWKIFFCKTRIRYSGKLNFDHVSACCYLEFDKGYFIFNDAIIN